MAKCQTIKHHKFFGDSRSILGKICENLSAIEDWQGGVINCRKRKKHLDIDIFPDINEKNIVLRFYDRGGSQDFYILRKIDTNLNQVLDEVVAYIQKYDSKLKINCPGQPKIKKEGVKKMVEKAIKAVEPQIENNIETQRTEVPAELPTQTDSIIAGMIAAHGILDNRPDCDGKNQFRILLDLIEKGSEEIENTIDSIFTLMSPPTPQVDCQTTAIFLQKQIKNLVQIQSDLQEEIQNQSENLVRINSVQEKTAKDIEAMVEKQIGLPKKESLLKIKIKNFANMGKYDKVQKMLNSAKLIKTEFDRLSIAISDETANLAKKTEEKSAIKNSLKILKAKRSAVEQDITALQKACKSLSRSIHKIFAIIESQPISAEIPEVEITSDEIIEEPAPIPSADPPADDIFAGYIEEEKQLLLDLENHGKYSGIGSLTSVEQLAKLGIPKALTIAIAAKGIEALKNHFKKVRINPDNAEKYIKALHKTGVLNSDEKIDFDKIKELLLRSKYGEKNKNEISAAPPFQSLKQPMGNGFKDPVSFGDGKSRVNYEAN